MNDRDAKLTARQAARIAGSGYLAIFVLALFANFFVRERLVEAGDAAATAANIASSEGLFRLGLVAFLFVFAADVAIAWALYVFFRRVHRDVSLLAAWFRLVSTTLLGVALIFFFLVLHLIGGEGSPSAFPTGQLDAQLLLYVEGFDAAWLIGLACFGIHLVLLGSLSVRSGFVPRAVGILLILAGAAYVIDTLAHALLSGYEDYRTAFLLMVAVPSLIGELWFAIWLLARGGRNEEARPAVRAPDPALSATRG